MLSAACGPKSTPETTPPADDENLVDLVVKGDYVVTMDADATIHEDAAIAIDEGVIATDTEGRVVQMNRVASLLTTEPRR
mgnify:CR=1 FL=1